MHFGRRPGPAVAVIALVVALAGEAAAEELPPIPVVTAPPTPPAISPAPPPPPPAVVVPAPAPPAPPPPEPERNPAAFRADFKLPFNVATLISSSEVGTTTSPSPFAGVPQLVLGFHYGRVGFGAGIGFTQTAITTQEELVNGFGLPGESGQTQTQTFAEVVFAPTLTVDVFQSADNKVAFYLLGAPIFGDIIETNEPSESDLGFQFALGANVALHENFRVGLEVGPVGHFYNATGNGTSESTVSIYTALVGSFLYPR
jgi:hypothetical protein